MLVISFSEKAAELVTSRLDGQVTGWWAKFPQK